MDVDKEEEAEAEEGQEEEDSSFDELDASSYPDRQLRVLGAMSYWESSFIPGIFKDIEGKGFGSQFYPERRQAFGDLFWVM